MLDRLDLGASLDERGSALDGLHMIRERLDDRFVRQINAAELVAVADGCGMEGQGDLDAVVQGAAAHAGGFR